MHQTIYQFPQRGGQRRPLLVMNRWCHAVALLQVLLLSFAAMGQTSIPNPGFENWSVLAHEEPDGWIDNNSYIPKPVITVMKIAGVSGNAVRLQTDTLLHTPGFIVNGNIFSTVGGVAYTGNGIPNALAGYYRYNIASSDSAKLVVILKKNGAVLAYDSFSVKGVQPVFTSFSLALSAVSQVPDSVIFAANSGTFSFLTGGGQPGNYLDLDELHFTNGSNSYPLVYGNFDNWPVITQDLPDSCNTGGNVTKSTDAHSGSFAAKLTTKDNHDLQGIQPGELFINTVHIATTGVDTITGYYKYSTAGNDFGMVDVLMFDQNHTGTPQSTGLLLPPASSYTYFKIPLTNTINAENISIKISSSAAANPVNTGVLLIDDLKLRHTGPNGVESVITPGKVLVYPNPAGKELHISLAAAEPAECILLDLSGRLVRREIIKGQGSFELNSLPEGNYILKVSAKGIQHHELIRVSAN